MRIKPERCSRRWGARSSRPLSSASRRRAASTHPGEPNAEWSLPHELFGGTPNRATGTVALPFSTCILVLHLRFDSARQTFSLAA